MKELFQFGIIKIKSAINSTPCLKRMIIKLQYHFPNIDKYIKHLKRYSESTPFEPVGTSQLTPNAKKIYFRLEKKCQKSELISNANSH